uniref:Uncharacterized protein n=1 Tax=Pseudonaja textilis TaxID=8673 RepID=A0A670XSM4_PSETE
MRRFPRSLCPVHMSAGLFAGKSSCSSTGDLGVRLQGNGPSFKKIKGSCAANVLCRKQRHFETQPGGHYSWYLKTLVL